MIRPDLSLFGYRVFSVARVDLPAALSAALAARVSLSVSDGCGIRVPLYAVGATEKALLSAGVSFEKSEPFGFPGFFFRLRKRYALIAALFLSVLYLVFVSDLVSDVRIEGNAEVSEAKIVCELSRAGLSVGSRWSALDRSEVENLLLSSSSDVSWIHINRRGTVAYVSVREKVLPVPVPEAPAFANIVASRAAVIEEITVRQGVPAVKPGDVVKEGDLLISGVLSDETGGGFVVAEGSVIGRVGESLSVSVLRTEPRVEYGNGEVVGLSAEIFGFPINIFKIYRNSDPLCVIIEEEKRPVLFGRAKLPFRLTVTRRKNYKIAACEARSDAELCEIAAVRANATLRALTADGDLISVKTEGHFTENGYEMKTDYGKLTEIGKTQVIGKD